MREEILLSPHSLSPLPLSKALVVYHSHSQPIDDKRFFLFFLFLSFFLSGGVPFCLRRSPDHGTVEVVVVVVVVVVSIFTFDCFLIDKIL